MSFFLSGVEFESIKVSKSNSQHKHLDFKKINYDFFQIGNYNLFFLNKIFALGFMERAGLSFFLAGKNISLKNNFSSNLNLFLAPTFAFDIKEAVQLKFSVGYLLTACAFNDFVSDELFGVRSGVFMETQAKILPCKNISPIFGITIKKFFYKLKKERYIIEFEKFTNSLVSIDIGLALNFHKKREVQIQ